MSRGHRHAPAMPTAHPWPDWTSRRARIVRVCRSNRVKSACNTARVIWKTDERESAFVSLSICVAHARHGSHVRYWATSTMHAACVTSIFRSCSGESHFSWSRREKNLEDGRCSATRYVVARILFGCPFFSACACFPIPRACAACVPGSACP